MNMVVIGGRVVMQTQGTVTPGIGKVACCVAPQFAEDGSMAEQYGYICMYGVSVHRRSITNYH